MLRLHEVTDGLVVIDRGSAPALDPAVAAVVDAVWAEQRRRRGAALHDGSIFSVTELSPTRIGGSFVPYRRFLAQACRPDLPRLVRPLAVTGLTSVAEGIVLGCRADRVTQDVGCWELVPAGGVDEGARTAGGTVSLAAQLVTELGEEAGIAADPAGARLLALVEDEDGGVVDAVLRLHLPMPFAALRAAWMAVAGREHDEIALLPWGVRPDAFRPLAAVSALVLDRFGPSATVSET